MRKVRSRVCMQVVMKLNKQAISYKGITPRRGGHFFKRVRLQLVQALRIINRLRPTTKDIA